jgi:predicted ester cyclase
MLFPRVRFILFTALLAIFLTVSPYTFVQGGSDKRDVYREVIKHIVEKVLNQADFGTISDVLANDYIDHTATGDIGVSTLQQRVTDLHAAMPDFKVTPELIIVDEKFVAARLVYRGTFKNALHDGDKTIAPNNKAIEWGHTVIYRFNDADELAEEFDAYDRINFLAQLGELPVPATIAPFLALTRKNVSVTEGSIMPTGLEVQRRATAAAFVKAVSDNKLDILDSTLDENYISYDSFGNLNRQGLKDVLAFFHKTAPDLEVVAEALIVEGDWVGVRLIYRGTFANDITYGVIRIPATNKKIQFAINVIARFNDKGLVVEDWREFNRLNWLQQLGLLSIPK